MTSSIDLTPRIRPVRYEPLAGVLDTAAACPHCGGALPAAAVLAPVAPAARAVVEDLPDSDVWQGPVRLLPDAPADHGRTLFVIPGVHAFLPAGGRLKCSCATTT